MNQRVKIILWALGLVVIAINFAYLIINRVYYVPLSGYITLIALIESFVFALLALFHNFKQREPKSRLIRILLFIASLLVYPMGYLILGLMSLGMGNEWGTQ